MCGIAGAYGWPRLDVSAMVERLRHRGPDAAGYIELAGMQHGHARLSLVDLTSASNQPFRLGSAVLTFNGEIWNYRAVRAELESLGVAFHTTGDTEVLAAALRQWGVDGALTRIEGMFALAWQDGATRVLVRDRYGKVPLYVIRRGQAFAWASERKAEPKLAGLFKALPPGSILDLGTGQVRRYYRPKPVDHGDLLPELQAAVAERLDADAPVCCLVSGGLDSSLILALAVHAKGAEHVTAFTAVLDPRSSDLAAARRIAAHYGVRLIEVDAEAKSTQAFIEAIGAIEIASKAQVEIAALCLPLAAAIRAEGFKACLSGEGADEIFGGYGDMIIKAYRADSEQWRQIRLDAIAKMARGNFVRCNKAFMRHGVEARLPMLRRGVVETALAMDKAQCRPGKSALKDVALRAGVPRWIIDRKKETFQGSAGASRLLSSLVADPAAFIRAETRRAFSVLAME